MSHAHTRRRAERGSLLIGTLFFVLITSILLMGVCTYAVSHLNGAQTDSDYAAALDLAEAGANYEFRKISRDTATADQAPGNTYNTDKGSFTVYCTTRNDDGTESTPWSGTGKLYVYSTGRVNGAWRTIKVSVKGFDVPGRYAIYTMDSISVWRGSALEITGDVGSNGQLDFTAHPTINGSIYFNGPDAGWYLSNPTGYTVARNPNAVKWPTVSDLATKTSAGSLTALATNNDNARANPPIVGNSITSSVTLTAGNYYITSMNLKGNDEITFDNSAGPVNIWIGPSNGTGTCRFRGGTAAIKTDTDPTKACHIYCATQTGIDLAGNEEIDALIYAYEKDSNGNDFGYVQNSGNPTLNGQILANRVDINGNITVNFTTDLVKPTSFGYFGYADMWSELNGR